MQKATHALSPAQRFVQQASQLLRERRIHECLACTDQALEMGADRLSVAHERWMCFALIGDFERAWQETDHTEAWRRRYSPNQDHLPPHLRRVWDGTSFDGKDVLVRCYHGLGDTIQFIRFLPPLAARASTIYLQAQQALAPLLRFSPAIGGIHIVDDDFNAHYDVEIELMELPYAFRTTLETIPREIPYLALPDSLTGTARSLWCGHGFKVGLVWSSGDWNPERNIKLREFSLLENVPALKLFSLQRGETSAQIADCPNLRVMQTEMEAGTLLDTAATVMSMDLIISVDTMVAHLAGTLGKAVWNLLPFRADWRWMIDRSDTPWYRAMRLFRQCEPGNWDLPIQEIKRKLLQSVSRIQPPVR